MSEGSSSTEPPPSTELISTSEIEEKARKRQADFKAVRLEPQGIIGRRAMIKSRKNSDWFHCFIIDYDDSGTRSKGEHLLQYEPGPNADKGQLLWVDLKEREFRLQDTITIKESQAACRKNPDGLCGRKINLRNKAMSFLSGEILDYDPEDEKHEIEFDNGQTILMKLRRYDFVLVSDGDKLPRSDGKAPNTDSSDASDSMWSFSRGTRSSDDNKKARRLDDTWTVDLGFFKLSFGK